MKLLALGFVLGFGLLMSLDVHAENLGKEVRIATFEGRPELNVVYGLEADPLLYIVLGVDSASFAPDRKINSLSVALYDSVNKVFVRGWEKTDYAGEIINGSLGLNIEAQAPAKLIGPAIKNLKVLFSVNSSDSKTATHYLDIGVFCQTHPDHFGDFETEKRGCPQ